MIHALSVSAPFATRYESHFENLLQALAHKHSLHYHFSVDCRPHLPLTFYSQSWRNGGDKIELHEVGTLSGRQILSILQGVFLDSPLTLKVTRVDLATDVQNVPVCWFHTHATVKFKRRRATFSAQPALKVEAGRDPWESLYFGVRNLYRVYDKVAELEYRLSKGALTEANSKLLASYRSQGGSWTRVERQCVDQGVPPKLNTLGALLHNASSFDPFQRFVLLTGGSDLQTRLAQCAEKSSARIERAYGIERLIAEMGFASWRAWENAHGSGHAQKTWDRHKDLIRLDSPDIALPDLAALYKASTETQFSDLLPLTAPYFGEYMQGPSRCASSVCLGSA